ncbi:MAG: hypothetical protein RSE62_03210 [Citrobacter sp.]
MRALRTVTRTPPAAVHVSASPVRRVGRITRHSPVAADTTVHDAKALIDEKLQLIAKNNADIATLALSNADAEKAIDEALTAANLPGYTNGRMEVSRVNTYSKESKVIDPVQFNEVVTPEVFWECIKVSVTEAKKHLTDKAIVDICSEIKGAVKTGTALKITEVKRKVVKA